MQVDAAIRRPLRAARTSNAGKGDVALVRDAQGGSEEAVTALVRNHWDAAYRAAFLIVHDRAAAEDIAQEAMLASIRSLDRFDRRRPFRPWLHRIVYHRALDWLRADGRRRETAIDGVVGDAAAEEHGSALSDDLVAALSKLDPDVRGLIVLRHLIDYSSRELGRMFDLPSATVRTKLARGLSRLRDDLEGMEIA